MLIHLRCLPLWERLSAAITFKNTDRPAPIITHVNVDPASGIGQLIDQRLLDIKLDAVSLQREVFAFVDGFADPTDRPFDRMSSPHDGAALENRHDPAEFGNELNLSLGQINYFGRFHCYRIFPSAWFQ
jgi:hypothetical protein